MTSNDMLLGAPTQVVHPWRAVARTLFQAIAGMATMGIVWVGVHWLGVDLAQYGDAMRDSIAYGLWIVTTGFYTWLMARPRVNTLIEKVAPFLATGVHVEAKGATVGDRPMDADRALDAVGIDTGPAPASTDSAVVKID